MKLFFNATDHQKLLWVWADACERHQVDCMLYCLMPNHYHFGIRTREANLSRAMHCVNAVFAQWWNRTHKHVGHVFQARFKAQIVESGRYMFNLTRYVMRNPLRAGLVDRLTAWPWSSYHATVGRGAVPAFLNTELALRVVGDGPRMIRQNRFRAFVEAPEFEGDDEMQSLVRGDARVIGSQDYCRRFEALAGSASHEVPRRERNLAVARIDVYLQQNVGRVPLPEVIRNAQAVGYRATAIADCLGLSVRTVRRLAATKRSSRSEGRHRGGRRSAASAA
jgi:REP element-mobilizing transposase RayT